MIVVGAALLLLLLLLFVVALVLALTVFKPKDPTTQLVSAALEGISPRLSLPDIHFQLNLTLHLTILLHNPNHVSFNHAQGTSVLFYRGNQIGDTLIYAGLIPAKGSVTLPSRLTLQVDRLASNITTLIGDVMEGQLSLESSTRIPGRISFLGFIKKHVLALSHCHFVVGVPDMKIRTQTCKNKAKF